MFVLGCFLFCYLVVFVCVIRFIVCMRVGVFVTYVPFVFFACWICLCVGRLRCVNVCLVGVVHMRFVFILYPLALFFVYLGWFYMFLLLGSLCVLLIELYVCMMCFCVCFGLLVVCVCWFVVSVRCVCHVYVGVVYVCFILCVQNTMHDDLLFLYVFPFD